MQMYCVAVLPMKSLCEVHESTVCLYSILYLIKPSISAINGECFQLRWTIACAITINSTVQRIMEEGPCFEKSAFSTYTLNIASRPIAGACKVGYWKTLQLWSSVCAIYNNLLYHLLVSMGNCIVTSSMFYMNILVPKI